MVRQAGEEDWGTAGVAWVFIQVALIWHGLQRGGKQGSGGPAFAYC